MTDGGGKQPRIDSGRVERGLEVAFGGNGESVLDALERLNGVKSRVLLADLGGDDTPVIRVPSNGDKDRATDDSRYQVLGEIARGGVGIILKSRDRDLGRDVALKVLKKELAQVPEVVQRFVEEAQIEGQLQHPGVVPVYGLGVQKDGRPYFAMKLVKGETLAAKIRSGGRLGRSRLIAAFEKVCQTVAYAHARKVIHRDLKPANILVGAFGEVQVVDWGFAKVLSRGGVADEHREEKGHERPDLSVIETVRTGSTGSESRVGSIMGTPGYMPPEQARGETEKIDERADVFSLGAILTEILTGKPPYIGNQGEQIHAAAKAKLGPAKMRLSRCGADPQLIDLAIRCMTPALAARPRHGGEVAEAITTYLASLETRRRKAELRAAAEKRTRKLSIALAASILLAFVLGGGGWFVLDNARRNRLESARIAVDGALREAGVLFGNAQAADVEKLEVWPPVEAKAEAAVNLAAELSADAEIQGEARKFLATVKGERASAKKLAAIVKDDRELSEQLWEVRLSGTDKIKPLAKNRNYGAWFRVRKIDVEADKPERVAAWIRERTIKEEIVAALDDWVHRLREEEEPATRLITVLGLVDDDEVRNAIREAATYRDLTKLRLIEKNHDLAKLPGETLVLLAETLGNCGEAASAVDVYRILVEREPESFRANAGLGSWLIRRAPPRADLAVDSLRTALEQREESVVTRQILAAAHLMLRDTDAALRVCREIHAREPEAKDFSEQLGAMLEAKAELYRQAGSFYLAAKYMREAVEYSGSTNRSLQRLGGTLLSSGQSTEAEEVGQRLVDQDRNNFASHMILGDARRMLGRAGEALASYRRARVLSPRSSRIQREMGRAHARLGDLEKAIECWRKAAELQDGYPPFYSYIAAASERLGRTEEAIAAAERALALAPGQSNYILALAGIHERAGHPEEARAGLDKAIRGEVARLLGLGFVRWQDHYSLGGVLGRRESAEEAVRQWRGWFPGAEPTDRAAFLHGLAVTTLYYRADAATSRRLVEEAIALAPEYGSAYQFLSGLQMFARESGEALASAVRAAKLQQGGGTSLQTLQSALLNCGRYEDAMRLTARRSQDVPAYEQRLESMERAAELMPRLPDIVSGRLQPMTTDDAWHFGVVLERAGHFDLAWAHYERYVAGREVQPDPLTELRVRQNLYSGMAWSALRAATGGNRPGRGVDAGTREMWYGRVLACLTEYMTALEADRRFMILESYARAYGPQIVYLKVAVGWAPIRDENRIARMPEKLRDGFTEFWRRFDAFWRATR